MVEEACFKVRTAPFSSLETIQYERAVLRAGSEVWVLLREARTPASAQLPVLTRCFEYIAYNVRTELVHLRGLPDRLRFFHCHYQMTPAPAMSWQWREVHLREQGGRYGLARWTGVSDTVEMRLIDVLSSMEKPQRMLP